MSALEGIRVLDLSRVLAGPWCTQTLGDLGAEVWKIEAPGGDDTRGWMPPEIDGHSTYFLCCNRNKKSVVIDLKSEEGRAAVRALARKADILVENFRLGTLERFGLDPETLRADNPGLITCSISGYGRDGPRADEPGYDFSIQAESGLMSITGEREGEPMKLGVAIADIVTGMNATQAILAALVARGRTGRGQSIDISLFESAVGVLANVASGALATGASPKRYGNAHATVVPYQLFDTAKGRIALAVGNDGQFRALCLHVLDRPDLAADERLRSNRGRATERERLIPELEGEFRKRPASEWIERCRAAGVPAGEVRSVDQVLASPEIAARGFVETVEHPLHGALKLLRSPLRLSETPTITRLPPPLLGEHTAEVLGGLDRE